MTITRWMYRRILTIIFFKYCKSLYIAAILITLFVITAYVLQKGFNEYSRHNLLQRNRELLSDYNKYTQTSVSDKCSPRSNIVFIKTHKCGSTTVQNVFMRYGMTNRKVFVMPATRHYLGQLLPFNRSLVPDPNLSHHEYNILAHHSRLNYAEMRALMPNDTLFVTILRNPVDLFESMFIYCRLDIIWNITIDLFNGEEFDIPEQVRNTRFANIIGINQMMFDLGVSPTDFTRPDVLFERINHFDSIFSLVMLSERMDESLVLLKHLLCWSTDDVVVFKLNARGNSSKSNLTESARNRLSTLNWADTRLYNHFKRKFEIIVSDFGEQRMKAEVKELRERTKQWYEYCVSGDSIMFINSVSIVYYVNAQRINSTCRYLTYDEPKFTNALRARQRRDFPGSVFPPPRKNHANHNLAETIRKN